MNDDYLWDGSGTPDADVVRLEQTLAAHRFDPARHPLRLTPRRRHRLTRYALAAALLLAVGGGIAGYHWRLDWRDGRPWPIVAGAAGAAQEALTVGTPWMTGSADATVAIARIGRLRVGANSQLQLQHTSSTQHLLRLLHGDVSLRVFAPPGRVQVQTPAGTVTDLGCAFDLQVDERGVALVQVRSGWVELENARGTALVPAGAASRMQFDRAPAVPVFDDADTRFRAAVRTIEDDGAIGDAADLTRARRRDVITLLMLARRLAGADRARVIQQAARLSPPPRDVDVDAAAVASGDDQALWRWHDALPLPPPKQWWRNWRDAWPLAP